MLNKITKTLAASALMVQIGWKYNLQWYKTGEMNVSDFMTEVDTLMDIARQK